MATSTRPSTAPLYRGAGDVLSTAEAGEAPLVPNLPGTHQFLGHEANHHDGQSTVGPRGNTVQAGQLPRVSGPPMGVPDAINPAGRGANSLTG